MLRIGLMLILLHALGHGNSASHGHTAPQAAGRPGAPSHFTCAGRINRPLRRGFASRQTARTRLRRESHGRYGKKHPGAKLRGASYWSYADLTSCSRPRQQRKPRSYRSPGGWPPGGPVPFYLRGANKSPLAPRLCLPANRSYPPSAGIPWSVWQKAPRSSAPGCFVLVLCDSYFMLSATATAQATVIPTMGLLPAPRKPIIST